MKQHLPIIILAAGESRRMRGRDKLLEDVDGVPLLRRQAANARAASRGPVIVALPPPPHPRYAALSGMDVTPLAIPDAKEGMNASLRASIAALPVGIPGAMVLLADLPEITAADIHNVLRAVDFSSDTLVWRGATESGAPGHPLVFSAALFPAFANLRGDGGGREIVALAGTRVKLVALPGQRARRDLDTPEDWAAWRAERGTR